MSNVIEDIRKSIEEIISETDEAQLLLYTVEEDIQMLQKDNAKLKAENAKLRELVRDMWHDGMCNCDEFRVCVQGEYHCAECEYHYHERMRELGIEVE